MNPTAHAKKVILTSLRAEVEHQLTHETQTDCAAAARAEMKRMTKGNKVEQTSAAWLKGAFSVYDMLQRQLKAAISHSGVHPQN